MSHIISSSSRSSTSFEELPRDVLACLLRRLDGRTLAAASCSTSLLHGLASDDDTWRALCLSTWPSLASLYPLPPPRRLFADAFPFPSPSPRTSHYSPIIPAVDLPNKLISAVDLYHNAVPLLSRLVETTTSSEWFLGTPFRIDAVDRKDQPCLPLPLTPPTDLTLSWIVMDPVHGRAVNVSSRRPVHLDRHWYTGETLVRFATVIGEYKFEAVVTCSVEGDHVREVSLAVEDKDGIAVSGEGSLGMLVVAMEGRRRGGEEMEVKWRYDYEEFVRRKRGRKERKARREVMVDLCCSAIGAAALVVFLLALLFR